MDIHERYAYDIQREIAFQKKQERQIILFRANCKLYLKFRTTMNERKSLGKTMATTIEYEDEQY